MASLASAYVLSYLLSCNFMCKTECPGLHPNYSMILWLNMVTCSIQIPI